MYKFWEGQRGQVIDHGCLKRCQRRGWEMEEWERGLDDCEGREGKAEEATGG